jgi:hypothetical protein
VINFRLKSIEKIHPVGQEPDKYLSWFWLTDGDLWLNFGKDTIYEYTHEALTHFEGKLTPYNDYYLVRFLEDFSGLFNKISESVPYEFYKLTADIIEFRKNTQAWLDIYDTDEEEHSDFYFEEYDRLISWTYQRLLNSMHLAGGPYLSFFRFQDKIRVVWDTEFTLEDGTPMWTAKNGSYEMEYSDFVKGVRKYGEEFFKAMDKQVELAISKEWQNVKIDKPALAKEHKERKLEFDKDFSFLVTGTTDKTNWGEIEQLYNRMMNEIK